MARLKMPSVSTRRGAPMGREERRPQFKTAGRGSLERVHIDAGGYDNGGAYWGHGERLYRMMTDEGNYVLYVRAATRGKARESLLKSYPNIRIRPHHRDNE